MKLFQYDKKVWEDGEVSRTWQFGIFKDRSFLWANYEDSSSQVRASGGLYVSFAFLSNSLFGVELNNNQQCLAFYFFPEYFEGWDD